MPSRLVYVILASIGLVLSPAIVHAQSTSGCGQRAGQIDYGAVRVGSVVIPQRHRFVEGDPNWDERMGRFLGREARVVRLSGVDARGCPGVRLDVDGARFFWRVRDLGGVPIATSEVAPIPEGCGMAPDRPSYGPIREGAVVVLGRHRAVAGDPNWMEGMGELVGHTARVVRLSGVDERGCPGVRVDADEGTWFWRIRDLRLAEDGGGPFPPGLASDHGRPMAGVALAEAPGDPRVPQACGMRDDTAVYAPVVIGSEVVLGRHRPVQGQDNWTAEMERYLGRVARVTELVGVDDQGCPLIRVDLDQGEWYWRLRDVHLP
jgi:hypothetical protein